MLDVKPIEEVVTKRSVVITLDEEEIAQVLVDPRGLQKALREQKHLWNGNGTVWSETGHASTRASTKAQPKRAGLKAAQKKMNEKGQRCPKCKRIFKRLGRHVSTCTGKIDAFDSAMAELEPSK